MKYRIQLQIPNVPYSVFRVDWEGDEEPPADLDDIVRSWAEHFAPLFETAQPVIPPEYQTSREQRQAPQRPPARPQGSSNAYGGPYKCPEHGVEVRPSARNKNMDFDEELGIEVPASWFHSQPDGTTHSVWRSALVKA